jgi:diguanylate cyclase (GGDEF)-like protein
MFGRSRSDKVPASTVVSPAEMGLDTLAAVLRMLGEFALDQERMAATSFAALAEAWAQHVLIGVPPPNLPEGAAAPPAKRRDWNGVREFVRGYCRGSADHAANVLGDLRQVVWVFIQNLGHAVSEDREADTQVRDRLVRLAALAHSATTGELKKEVLSTVQTVSQIMEDRRRRQREQIEILGQRVQTLGTELESARREGETDPLTGLYNRRAFDEQIARCVEMRRVFGHESFLLFADLDHLKKINDTRGHPVGDEVLVKVAQAMTRAFPRKGDFVARIGGDEFAAILRETDVAAAGALAERLVRLVRAIEAETGGERIAVSVSVGVAGLAAGQDGPTWMRVADEALYRAKESGRNGVAVG